jgi:hypothetical protein
MSKLLLSFLLIFSFAAQAETYTTLKTEADVEAVIHNTVDVETTCIDEYLVRSKQLRRFLIWAPPVTVVGGAVGSAAVGLGTIYAVEAAGSIGWAALGWGIFGTTVTAAGAVITFVALETTKAVRYVQNKNMMEAIAFSHADDTENKRIQRFLKKYNKKYAEDDLTAAEMMALIRDMDATGKLCDGSLTKKKGKKLKHKLASKKDLFAAIHKIVNP